jgi:hypothetical protein
MGDTANSEFQHLENSRTFRKQLHRIEIVTATPLAFAPEISAQQYGEQIRLRDLPPTPLAFAFFFLFQRFSLVRHHAPTASQIEVRSSKHVIRYLSGLTPALVRSLPTFISTVRHHGGSSPSPYIDRHPSSHILRGRPESAAIFRLFFLE